MFPTIVQRLAACAAQSRFDRLSANVVDQCKRILLDPIGCAVAAIDKPKDSASIETLNGNGASSAGRSLSNIRTTERISRERSIRANMLGRQGAAMLLSSVSSRATLAVSNPSPES